MNTSSPNKYWPTAFVALAALGFWYMRIDPSLHDVPRNYLPLLKAGTLPDGSTPLRLHYTGVAALDAVLPWLVLAFAAGPLRLDPAVRLQQMHFLVQFASVLAIWNIEAYRPRNRGRIIAL